MTESDNPKSDNSEDRPVLFDPSRIKILIDDYGRETAASLLGSFKRIARDTADKLIDAAEQSDLEALQRYAHDLKGNSSTVGLIKLAQHCRLIEGHCIDGKLEEACLLAGPLADLLEQSLYALPDKLP